MWRSHSFRRGRPRARAFWAGAALCLGASLVPALGSGPAPPHVVHVRAVLEYRRGGVRSLSFSPDGKLLAAACGYDRGGVRVWDVAQVKEVTTLQGFSNGVAGLAFSPDGKLLATTGARVTARLYETSTWKVRRTLKAGGGSSSVAFSPDGKILATTMVTHTVFFWDVATGKGLPGPVSGLRSSHGVAFSPDGRAVAVAGWKEAVLWAKPGWGLRAALKGHKGPVSCLAFSPDSKTLATGEPGLAEREHHILLWEVATGKRKGQLSVDKYSTVDGCAFSPDGKGLVVVGAGVTQLWDVKTGRALVKFQPPATCNCVAFSPNGRTLAVGVFNGVILLYDVPRGG
jgi:WD40 repeat protein